MVGVLHAVSRHSTNSGPPWQPLEIEDSCLIPSRSRSAMTRSESLFGCIFIYLLSCSGLGVLHPAKSEFPRVRNNVFKVVGHQGQSTGLKGTPMSCLPGMPLGIRERDQDHPSKHFRGPNTCAISSILPRTKCKEAGTTLFPFYRRGH